MRARNLLAFLLLSIPLLPACAASPVSAPIARDGTALLGITVAADASGAIRQSAMTLAEYLGRITGAEFSVVTGGGSSGIAVGLPAHFPELRLEGAWLDPGMFERERYLLRSHAQGLYVVGATELAVEHAVWDLLRRLGYRQFFPGKAWEVVPEIRDLAVPVDAEESPDFHTRRIWYGFGAWDYAEEPYRQWCSRNRTVSPLNLNTGHAYGNIVASRRADFEKHPEYFALIDGQRQSAAKNPKFCISNPGLRKLVVEYANQYFQKNPSAESVSMDPSDGGGWCQCEACARMGSTSHRVLTLANQVAESVAPRGKLVGLYAYNFHSPPPQIRVHPQVVVSVATAFIKGGFTLDEILSGWSAQGATVGIREYYSVNTWDRDLPGRARGSKLEYLARTIPDFHSRGARFLSAESSDNWGPNGLGYYLASRMLWDIDEAKRIPELVDDFLHRAFGPAQKPMAEFYEQLDGSQPHLVFDDQLGRMYRALAAARGLADRPEIHARLDELILYTRYADLFDRYSEAQGPARQAAFESLIRHAYRMRSTMMVHSKALYRDLASRDKRVSIPAEAKWDVPEGRNPWKSSSPFSPEELRQYLEEGIATRLLVQLDVEPIGFTDDLVPAKPLNLAPVAAGKVTAGRGKQSFYVWIEDPRQPLELTITGGLIAHYRDRGNVRVELWELAGPGEAATRETKVAQDASVSPDGAEHRVRLAARRGSLHKLTVSDGHDMTRVSWMPGTRVTLRSSIDDPVNQKGRWTLYFYVPRDTKVIGLFGGGSGEILDPDGGTAFAMEGRKPGYYTFPVPQGQAGKLWKIRRASGAIRLLTVPPYLARSPEELLLPREVVVAGPGSLGSGGKP